ncbi:MAG: D-aminoacylase [Candidatus Latescibacteria bacterium]|nr:D-aminoacylase [Candidatus Latescibacterota bacterium]
MYDLIITNGTLIDGSRAPRHRVDVGIRNDRIAALGDLHQEEARQRIDAAGKIVAPGFVDVHNHSDAWLLKIPHLLPKTTQGFTSEVIMADGISYAPVDRHSAPDWIFYMRALNALLYEEYSGWQSLGEYMARLDGRCVQNAITHLPYANVRVLAYGYGRAAPDDFQMAQIRSLVEQGMAEGAVGLSTGLDYISECFASTAELAEACAPMAAQGGLYVSHVRYKKGTLEGVKEAVEIGRRAGVPVHISHLKGTTPEQIDAILTYIDKTAVHEVDFSFDVYPYLPGSTMLNFLLPYEVWEEGPMGVLPRLREPQIRARFAQGLAAYKLDQTFIAWLPGKENSRYLGKSLAEYVGAVGKPAADALCDLLIEEHLAVLLVFHYGDDQLVFPFLAHEKYMMGTDGIYFPDGAVHPRMYGSAGRLLGSCVRDHHLFTLEDAVYKLSAYPSVRFGLKDRGLLREGAFADVVVFDSQTVADRATYKDPHQFCTGIEQVIVNGVPIIRDSAEVKDLPTPLPGRALKFKQ